jgi:beta-glucosidase
MQCKQFFLASLLCFAGVFAAQMEIKGYVKAQSENGTPIENAVVLLKVNDSLIAYARTLSRADGYFELASPNTPGDLGGISSSSGVVSSSGNSSSSISISNTSSSSSSDIEAQSSSSSDESSHILRSPLTQSAKFKSYRVLDLHGKNHNYQADLPQGVYVLLGKTETGKTVNLGKFYHRGGTVKVQNFVPIATSHSLPAAGKLAKATTSTGAVVQLIVRKAGYLPKEVEFSSFIENVGNVVLQRDPLEARIDSVMNLMTLDDKIYQMTQPQVGSFGNGTYLYGSVLHGGDTYSGSVLTSMSTSINSYNPKIPVTYGKDMMHGAAAITNATIFPHNIGMGATRDSALVRKACEITAQESWAGNVDLIFGPAISVPQDERWGRTYEGFGETAELAVMMGAACIRGYQGTKYDAPWRVIATAKHYLADGSTTNGKDRGNNATITDKDLREIHLPGYEAAVEQGVLSVMASFNQIRGVHQHIDSLRLTGWLKTELGFDGYIISDWLGIGNSLSPGATDANNYGGGGTTDQSAIKNAINAGIDLAMEPGTEATFISGLKALVNNGVPQARIDDAVRRILRAKFRAGRMDNPAGIRNTVISSYGNIGSDAHREVAREAVRKSLVLLKNDNNALPISKSTKVYLFGQPAAITTNTSYQCGGWTIGWQGSYASSGFFGPDLNSPRNVSGATSIDAGIKQVAPNAITTNASEASVIIYVTGEKPYAEWQGDSTNITFADNNAQQLNTYKNQGKKVVTVFISGRPRETNSLLNASDAFVAAWLPGSEGAGIADVLFGEYPFTGKLPHTWPRDKSAFPVNSTQTNEKWFPYGFGLSY